MWWPTYMCIATALSASAEATRTDDTETDDAETVVCDIYVFSRSDQRTAICAQPEQGCRPLLAVEDAVFHIDGSFSEWLHFDWAKYPLCVNPDSRCRAPSMPALILH
ncbi:MAG: hypothetical protein AAF605_06695 [Myxococcota bacterium]|mgnify:CR=1 FL=1